MSVAPIPNTGSTRHAGLDILRCFAVLLVFCRHVPGTPESWPAGIAVLQRGGWVGVDLFFVLSGFLVSGLLFRQLPQVRPGAFLWRRGLRIYPPFYALVLLWPVVLYALGQPGNSWRPMVHDALFVQNYIPGVGMLVHTWSLAVEEHFYLLLAVGLWALPTRRAGDWRTHAVIAAVAALVCLTLRLRLMWVPYDQFTHLFPTHLRLDTLLLGVALAAVVHLGPHDAVQAWIHRHARPLLAAGVGLLSPAFIWTLEQTPALLSIGLTVLALGALAIVTAMLPVVTARHWLTRQLAFTGRHSYSIYLWHAPVFAVVKETGPSEFTWHIFIACIVLSVSTGIVFSWLIEEPFLRWRDRPVRSMGVEDEGGSRGWVRDSARGR